MGLISEERRISLSHKNQYRYRRDRILPTRTIVPGRMKLSRLLWGSWSRSGYLSVLRQRRFGGMELPKRWVGSGETGCIEVGGRFDG